MKAYLVTAPESSPRIGDSLTMGPAAGGGVVFHLDTSAELRNAMDGRPPEWLVPLLMMGRALPRVGDAPYKTGPVTSFTKHGHRAYRWSRHGWLLLDMERASLILAGHGADLLRNPTVAG